MVSRRALDLFSEIASHLRPGFEVDKVYAPIESALAELVGFKLLTILRLEGSRVRRLHSSDLQSYPMGGTKDISKDAWLREMLKAGQPVVSNAPGVVQERFLDHQAIFSLGCGAVLNIPIANTRGTLGSLNLLHEASWFNGEHVLIARSFAALLTLAWSEPAL
jgi:hypothetical protein